MTVADRRVTEIPPEHRLAPRSDRLQIRAMSAPKLDFSQLTPSERLDLIEALWDSLDPDDAAPITPELAAELDRRSAEAEADPHGGRTWEEVRADLQRRHP